MVNQEFEKIVREFSDKVKAIVELVSEREKIVAEMNSLNEKLENIEKQILAKCSDEIVKLLPEDIKNTLNGIREKYSSSVKKYRRKRVFFLGQEYANMQYFMKKFQITGGVEGIKAWAEQNNYDCLIDDEKIIITPRLAKQ